MLKITEYAFWALSLVRFLVALKIGGLCASARNEVSDKIMQGQRKDDWRSCAAMVPMLLAESAGLTAYPEADDAHAAPPIGYLVCWIGFLGGVYLQSFLLRRTVMRVRWINSVKLRG